MPNNPSSTKVNIMMSRTLRVGVDKLTEKTGATMAEITRRALTAYLKEQGITTTSAAIDCKTEA